GAPTAIGLSGVRRYQIRLLRGHQRPSALGGSDRSAPKRSARRPAARQRRRPDAENFGGEVSFLNLPTTSRHSMTSSARPSSGRGTVSPSALAVLRLITSVYFSDCWIGKSPGFVPLRMRST